MIEFAQLLSEKNPHLQYFWGQGLNHFEMLKSFASPDGLMSQALLDLMHTEHKQK
jgi:hypothetical protein